MGVLYGRINDIKWEKSGDYKTVNGKYLVKSENVSY